MKYNLFDGINLVFVAFLWQLMRFNILQDLNNLWFHSQGKEITDVDVLNWANCKVKSVGKSSQIESFKVNIFIVYVSELSQTNCNLFLIINLFRIKAYRMECFSWNFLVLLTQG